MKTLCVFALICVPTLLRGDTRELQPATPESIVGGWQALVQDGTMATEIYQMAISDTGDARFIHLLLADPSGGAFAYAPFFGRAASFTIANGSLTVRFKAAPKPKNHPDIIFKSEDVDWIEIQAHAIADADGPLGEMRGKIITHRAEKYSAASQSEQEVTFRKGEWFQHLENLATQAHRVLEAR